MYCVEPEGIMEQEQEYLVMLQNAETYDIKGDQLRILTGDEVLIFELE
jgi:heat shock protein HslJ